MRAPISIVVPTRGTPDLLRACLGSLPRSGVEVVVVDDGGGDDATREVVDGHPCARRIARSASGGFTVAANEGMAAAGGDLLLLLNSDTELTPDGLERLARAFADDPDLGIAGGRLVYPDGSPQWSGGREPGLAWLFAQASGAVAALSRLRTGRRRAPWRRRGGVVDWVSGAALALRREVWDRVGPLDERFRLYAQDLDLCIRAGDAGWAIRILPHFEVLHHHGATINLEAGGRRDTYDVGVLWPDLLAWAEKRRGRVWSWCALLALGLGITIRSAGLVLAALPAPGGVRRRRLRAAGDHLRAAGGVLRDRWRRR